MSPSSQKRRSDADLLVREAGWAPVEIQTKYFELKGYVPNQPNTFSQISIYIEGDGAAWKNSYTPSDDPTPIDPIALKLALQQAQGYAMYIARPCQFTRRGALGCHQKYWTDERFSEEVIESISEAIDVLKKKSGATSIQLIGFSGGGAVATLVATRRSDIAKLVTISGNLNVTHWVLLHGLTPLNGLDPINIAKDLQTLPQVHFVGSDDQNIRPDLVEKYLEKIPKPNKAKIKVIQGNTHNCCWVEQWKNLWPDVVSIGTIN